MSALRAARVGDHGKHGFLPEGRDGAGDESTGRDAAGKGEENHLVAISTGHFMCYRHGRPKRLTGAGFGGSVPPQVGRAARG